MAGAIFLAHAGVQGYSDDPGEAAARYLSGEGILRRLFLLLQALLLPISASQAAEWQASAIPDSLPHYTISDSLLVDVAMKPLIVTARALADTLPGSIHLDEDLIRDRPGLAIADLGPLLPSVRVGVNSRGETLFMLRGAPERHIHAYLDGIPLTIPWDERADLSILPADAIGGVSASRGAGSVLAGPGVLAGTVRLTLREGRHESGLTRLSLSAGQGGAFESGLLHERRQGDWSWLAAYSMSGKDSWRLPADHGAEFNQAAARERTNSDAGRSSVLFRAARDLPGAGKLAFSFIGVSGEKGVPPEIHIADARFWRYPLQQRGLLGASLRRSLGGGERWRIEAGLSADLFDQEIRSFDDTNYNSPPLAGSDYETDSERTLFGRLKLAREFLERGEIAVGGSLRRSRHAERLTYGGPSLHYSQNILGGGAELRIGAGSWDLNADVGAESAATPETGDKPARDAESAGAIRLSAARPLAGDWQLQASASRRSRFPSLREMFSGALGKFVPNPGLGPERQDLLALGCVRHRGRSRIEFTVYGSRLEGGIEKRAVPGETSQFQRVNVTAIRNLGLEFIATLRPRKGLSVTLQSGLLHSRQREGGSYDAPSEDRASHLSSCVVTWLHATGLRFRVEGRMIGARHSADSRPGATGLARLPTQSSWNLRCGYLFPWTWLSARDVEAYLRLDNLFDQRIDSQLGLPAPGRMLRAGIALSLGA